MMSHGTQDVRPAPVDTSRLAARSSIQPFANWRLNLAIVWGLAPLALIVYTPFLHEPFSTVSLPLVDWAIVVVLASTVSPVLESEKRMKRREWFGEMG